MFFNLQNILFRLQKRCIVVSDDASFQSKQLIIYTTYNYAMNYTNALSRKLYKIIIDVTIQIVN